MSGEYNGDSISDSEWFHAEIEDIENEFMEHRKDCNHEPGSLNYMGTDYTCKKCGADCGDDV